VLASLAVGHLERRLDDLVEGWARVGAGLMSVQRMQTLVKGYPERVQRRLADFARFAVEAGDRRWERIASAVPTSEPAAREK
jgi:hypothetical protein